MQNPFDTGDMAAGYASSRPAVHPRVMEKVYRALGRTKPFERALDIGCGAGVSTRALNPFAKHSIGIEPAEPMLQWRATTAPSADFLVGLAEAIPLRPRSVDLITAAGSLNYVNLDAFFPEAKRVLEPQGVLVVYDFSPGRSFTAGSSLDEWFRDFGLRYPSPPNEARPLNPAVLEPLATGFQLQAQEHFEISLPLTLGFYVNYMLTETNVAAAVRRGVPVLEIRSWCEETLRAIWNDREREVLFRGYFACLAPVE